MKVLDVALNVLDQKSGSGTSPVVSILNKIVVELYGRKSIMRLGKIEYVAKKQGIILNSRSYNHRQPTRIQN